MAIKTIFYKVDNKTRCTQLCDEDCFIATAVYGNRDMPQVQTLRDFRDDVLMNNALGRAFIGFYYSGAGKRAADFVKEHLPSAIPVLRKGLDVLVERHSAQRR